MKEYIGGEFILTSNSKGLTIKRNDSGHGCGEFFEWEEIRHLFDAPKNTIHNTAYTKCHICKGEGKVRVGSSDEPDSIICTECSGRGHFA